MKTTHYLLLTLSLLLFFGVNFLIYTTDFGKTKNEIKANIIDTRETKLEKNYLSILNFGDAMFDRGVRNIMENRRRDPFEYIKKDLSLIKDYDVIIANLEGPIVEVDRAKCQTKAYNFQFASTTMSVLKSIGINMVNIANNHSYDCYKFGFESTKQYLKSSNIDYIGDSKIEDSFVLSVIDGKRIAFIGVDQTVSPALNEEFYSLIKKLDLENDYVIVNIHWGEEYMLEGNNTQKDIAHKLIDNGVDVIFGHHPHVVEPVEIYKNKVIFYSLGNFVFDQNFGDTMVGLGAGVEFKENKNIFELFPFNIKIFAPDFMKDEEKNEFCDKFLKQIEHNGCEFII